MKNIFQLAKAARRLQRYINSSMKRLTAAKSANPSARPWKGISKNDLGPKQLQWHQARVMACHQSLALLRTELAGRRVGLSAHPKFQTEAI